MQVLETGSLAVVSLPGNRSRDPTQPPQQTHD